MFAERPRRAAHVASCCVSYGVSHKVTRQLHAALTFRLETSSGQSKRSKQARATPLLHDVVCLVC